MTARDCLAPSQAAQLCHAFVVLTVKHFSFKNPRWCYLVLWTVIKIFKVNSVQEACTICFSVHILKIEILQSTWKKWSKEHQTLSFHFFTNRFSIMMFFDLQDFNFEKVNCKEFGASFLYWVDFITKIILRKLTLSLFWSSRVGNGGAKLGSKNSWLRWANSGCFFFRAKWKSSENEKKIKLFTTNGELLMQFNDFLLPNWNSS